jgi:sec-independent protein translocase protein TatB
MEILGIGPSELLFVVVLALIILGPREMQKAGRTLGRWLRQVVTSDGWKYFQQTSREIQTLPNRLMREAALEELREMEKDLREPPVSSGTGGGLASQPGSAPASRPSSPDSHEPIILPSPPPPVSKPGDNEPDA